MKHKKLFAILTLVCFMFTLMPVAAFASTGTVVKVSTAEEFAVATTQSGITIELQNDIVGPGVFIEKNQNLVIDLGKHTYTVVDPTVGSEGTKTQGLHFEGDVTLKNGNIVIDKGATVKMLVQNYADLTLEDVVLDGTNGTKPSNMAFYTLSNNSGTVSIEGSTSIIAPTDGVAFDVYDSSSYSNKPNVTVNTTGTITGAIEVSDSIKDNLKIQAGTFSDLATAVKYADKDAVIKLAGDATTVEGSGIVVPSGKTLTIDFGGKTYTVNEAVGSTGTKTLGMQILNGSTVTLQNGTLAAASDSETPVKMLINNYANLTVKDMTLDATNCTKPGNMAVYALSNNSGTISIEGATSIIAPADGVAFDVYDSSSYSNKPNVTVNTTGTITGAIEVSDSIKDNLKIQAGTFSDLANAVKYADKDAVIKLAGDTTTVEGSGIVVPSGKTLTIDFGGKTYTVNEAVGSTGTKTLGMQILNGSTVTLQNGTLAAASGSETPVKMLINNYANLTVKDMTLDARNCEKPSTMAVYALSNNSGTVSIEGATSIIAPTDGVAFDVYDSSSYSNKPNVTVNTTGTITGAIEVSDSIKDNLKIQAGTFTADPTAYLADGKCAKNANGTFVVGTHNIVKVADEVSATCTETGTKAYYKCENSGQLYSDEAGTIKIDAPEVISKVAHTYDQRVVEDNYLKSAATTCGESYVYYKSCRCGAFDVEESETFVGASRSHAYAVEYDATGHWTECACGDKTEVVAHVYDSSSDTTCNDCEYTRTISYGGGGSYVPSTSDKTESSTTTETVTPNGTTVTVEKETAADGTVTETTTTTTASGETTVVEKITETTEEGTTVETTTTTDATGETSTTVTATLENGSAVTNNDDAVEVEVTAVEEAVVEAAQEAVADVEEVNVVGTADAAVSVSATNAATGAAQTDFVQPMSVTVPVDTTVLDNVTDTSKLTMAKVVTNEDGTTELVYMGGSYDKATGTFNAKVDEDGDYILVEKADLVKIELTIDETAVKHNDRAHQMDVAPKINAEVGRTELPLRYLGEALGFGIHWSDNNVVTITKGDISFSLTIGQEIPGFGTPYVEPGADRTMVSARYISEMLGANVIWDPVDRQVIVVQ